MVTVQTLPYRQVLEQLNHPGIPPVFLEFQEELTLTRILFVCLGNICRSPMAACVMTKLVQDAGLQDAFVIDSAATSAEELGNPIYPPARKKLQDEGIPLLPHAARQMQMADYKKYDLIIGMDRNNIKNMERLCGGDPEGKIHLLLDYAGRPGEEVADPWYTRNFDAAWNDIDAGCRGLLRALT